MTAVANLIGLQADAFRHPFDREATRALKQLPGLDLAVRGLLGSVAEQALYLNNIATSVRVSERQLPELHALLVEACERLDIEPPQLYLQQHPAPNAYTFAMRGRQPFIVLHTSLVDLLEPAEIQAVIAHELGHLKCEHGLYLTLVNLFVLAAGLIPSWGIPIAQSLQVQMLEWVRCAEFTCDRAALLAVGDPKIVMSVLMKLAGGSPTIAPKLNLEAFVEQARAYETLGKTELGELLRAAQTEQLTHPLPVLRAKEIDRWAHSGEYQELISRYTGEMSTGKWRNW